MAVGCSFGVVSWTTSNLCSCRSGIRWTRLPSTTGGEPERPKYYPEDRAALLDYRKHWSTIRLWTFRPAGEANVCSPFFLD